MSDRPHIICHMTSSIDGALHPSRYTASPDGEVRDWSAAYERWHEALAPDGWIVGRVTMAEMAKGEPHLPAAAAAVERPVHVAVGASGPYGIALDPSARLHFRDGRVGGDGIVVVLSSGVSDAHLAELAADGVSYIVSDTPEIDVAAALATLRTRFGMERLLLEGGAGINGRFLAAGLVDELSVVVAPALDGGTDVEGIVAVAGGLKGKVRLAFASCEAIGAGAVHLRYRVLPG